MTSDRNTGNDSYEVRHIALEYLKNLEFENADISAISEGFLANEDLWDNIRLISSFSSDLIPEYIYNLAGKRLDKIILLQVVCPSSVESIKFMTGMLSAGADYLDFTPHGHFEKGKTAYFLYLIKKEKN